MAYTFDFLNEEEKKQQGGQPQQSQSVGGGTIVPSQQQAPQQKGSGSFVNLQKYLTANKQQGDQLAGNVTGNVEQQGQQAGQQIQTEQQDLSKQIQQGSVQQDDIFNQNVAKNATDIFNNQQGQDFNQVKRTLSGEYQGPQNAQLSEKANLGVQQAQEAAKQLNDERGREALLKKQYARPDYSQGQVSLDNLLFGGAQGLNQRVGDVNTKAGALTGQLNDALTQGTQAIEQGKQGTVAAQKALKDLLQNTSQSEVSDLQKRVADYNAARNQYNTTGQLDTGNKEVQNLFSNLGNAYKTAQQGEAGVDQNVDWSKTLMDRYGSRAPVNQGLRNEVFGNEASINDFANQDQRARLQALSGLGGFDTVQFNNPFTNAQEGGLSGLLEKIKNKKVNYANP